VRRASAAVGTVLIGLFIVLNVRELGHTAAAWLEGDHNASYELRCAPAGSGCNHFDATGMSVTAKLAGDLSAERGRRLEECGSASWPSARA
jgi:hypothetical protein